MRTLRRCTPALLAPMVLCLCSASVGLLAGCGDSEARGQREAQRAIEEANTAIRSAIAAAPGDITEEGREQSRRTLGEIAARLERVEGAPGQQGAAALLRAAVQTRMGLIEAETFDALQNAQRMRRGELLGMLETAATLARLADSADRFDPQAERQLLESARQQTQSEIEALKGRVADLDRPMESLRADNQANRGKAQTLDAEERSLRQDARARGHAAGFPIFMTAIDRRTQADSLRIRMARNDIQIAELAPERELASVTMSSSEEMIGALIAAERYLQQGVDGARGRAATLRGATDAIHRQALAIVEEIGAGLRGPVAESHQRAAQDLERAAQSAGRAASAAGDSRESTGAARQAGASARQALASLHLSRLLDSRDVVASLREDIAVAGQSPTAAALASAIREVRSQQEKVESELREPTTAAINAAIEAVAQLGDRPAIVQTRTSLTRMLDAVDQRAETAATGDAPASGMPGRPGAGATAEAGAASPEEIVEFLNAMDPNDAAQVQRFFGLMRGSTAQARQFIGVARPMLEDMSDMIAAMTEQFGTGFDTGSLPGMPGFAFGGTLRIAEQTDRTATLVGPEVDEPIRLMRSAGRWFLDVESLFSAEEIGELGPMAAVLESMRPTLRTVYAGIAARIRAGEFSSPEEVTAAIEEAMMAEVMGQMMGSDASDLMRQFQEAGGSMPNP